MFVFCGSLTLLTFPVQMGIDESVIHLHQAKALCRCRGAGCPPVFGFYDPGNLFRFDFAESHLKQGAHNNADHMLQKAVDSTPRQR